MTRENCHRTHDELVRSWAEAADAKLRADNVDRNDLEAVRIGLSECIGGPRLYDFWRAVYHPQMTLEEVTQ